MSRDEVKLGMAAITVFGGAALVFARRWRNSDAEAGYGLAAWSVIILICVWLSMAE